MTDERPGQYPGDEPPQPPAQQPTPPPPAQQPTPPPAGEEALTPPPGMPEERDDTAVLEGAGDFTSGEGLVAFAGLVVIAGWLIFSVILADYGTDWLMLSLAVAAALLPRLDQEKVERFHPLPHLMKVIGYGLALLALFSLILDVRYGILDDFSDILGGLVTYAAGAMAFMGARQIQL